eukprot:3327741-Pleurochrysis_carterae.AAC.2
MHHEPGTKLALCPSLLTCTTACPRVRTLKWASALTLSQIRADRLSSAPCPRPSCKQAAGGANIGGDASHNATSSDKAAEIAYKSPFYAMGVSQADTRKQ